MLTINNIYGHGYGKAQIERLHSLGFTIYDQGSRFAGSQLLRFIFFPERPYLEFIKVESESEYFDFLPNRVISSVIMSPPAFVGKEEMMGDMIMREFPLVNLRNRLVFLHNVVKVVKGRRCNQDFVVTIDWALGVEATSIISRGWF